MDDRAGAERLVNEEIGRAMELEVCSVRLLVVHVGSNDHVVVLNVHHMATDGWSTSLLTEDVVLAYNAYVRDDEVVFGVDDGARLRYTDYVMWQREVLSDDMVMEPHVKYWRVPTDRCGS